MKLCDKMSLIWIIIAIFLHVISLKYVNLLEPTIPFPTNATSNQEVVAVILEMCENERKDLENVEVQLRSSNVGYIYKMECKNYLDFASILPVLNNSAITRIIMVARREALRFAESSLKPLSVKDWTAIPINNDLLVAGLVQSQMKRSRCKDRAGGKQFWGLMMALLPDIIDNWQWRNLYLYVDEIFGLTEAKQVYNAFREYQKIASLKVIMTTKTSPYSEFLARLSHWDRSVREVKAVIIVCDHHMTQTIIEEATKMRLFSTYFRWLIFDNGTAETLKNFKIHFDTDVVLVRHYDKMTIGSSLSSALEVAKLDPTPSPTSPISVSTRMPYGSRSKSVVNLKTVDTESSECYSESYLSDLQFNKNANRSRTIGKEYLPADFHLEFFRLKRRLGAALTFMEPFSEWDVATGFFHTKPQTFDFDGYNLQVVAIHCPPYVFVQRSVDGRFTFSGYLVDVLEALSLLMNFKYNITVPFDHTYGRCEDSLCSGIIGMLVRREAELALANLTPTGNRVKLMDFSTVAVDNAGLGMLLRRPSKSDTNAIKAYIMPFSMEVSICVAFAIPLCGILLHIALRSSAYLQRGTELDECLHDEPKLAKDNRSLGRCLFVAMQSFGQQGIDIIPTSISGRAVFGVMWIFSLFIMSSYTANLISYFTSSIITWPFKSLDEVYASRYYQLGFIKGTTYLDDIQGDNKTILTKIWNRMEKQRFTTLVDDLEEGVERVRAESFILIHEARVLEYVAARDCEFAMIAEQYLSAPMTLAFQKHSQFQRPISQMLLTISESGLLSRLKNRWWPPTFDCTIASQSFSSISLWGVLSVYGILMGGLVLGLLILAIEKIVAAQKLKKRLLALSKISEVQVPKSISEKISQALHFIKKDEPSSDDKDQPSTSS